MKRVERYYQLSRRWIVALTVAERKDAAAKLSSDPFKSRYLHQADHAYEVADRCYQQQRHLHSAISAELGSKY